jgi:hypothetical protein
MTDLSLGEFIELILTELADSFDRTVKPADLFKAQVGDADFDIPEALLKLHVSELDLDLPARLQVRVDPISSTRKPRLTVSLPDSLETPGVGRLGRIRMTIAPESRSQNERKL